MTLADLFTPGAIIGVAVWGWTKLEARLDRLEVALTGHMVKSAEQFATKPEVKEAIDNHEKAFHE